MSDTKFLTPDSLIFGTFGRAYAMLVLIVNFYVDKGILTAANLTALEALESECAADHTLPAEKLSLSLAQMWISQIAGLASQAIADGFNPEAPEDYKEPEWDRLRADLAIVVGSHADAEARLTEKRKSLDATIAKLNATFETSNAELLNEVAEAHALAEDRQSDLRTLILENFLFRGDKQIATGLSVRINTAYEFKDADAITFAIDRKMPELLKPDATAFKKQMALTPQPFCKVVKTAGAVVSLK